MASESIQASLISSRGPYQEKTTKQLVYHRYEDLLQYEQVLQRAKHVESAGASDNKLSCFYSLLFGDQR
jgi:hypothetical protein